MAPGTRNACQPPRLCLGAVRLGIFGFGTVFRARGLPAADGGHGTGLPDGPAGGRFLNVTGFGFLARYGSTGSSSAAVDCVMGTGSGCRTGTAAGLGRPAPVTGISGDGRAGLGNAHCRTAGFGDRKSVV